MKSTILLLSSILIFSCSTRYQSGQTPDDVYYSPERKRIEKAENRDEYVRVEKKDNRRYQSPEDIREERYLRMKTQYRRFSFLENDCDCYCNNTSANYRYHNIYLNNNFGYYANPVNAYWGYKYNPYYYNPYYANPYYSGYVAGNVKPVYNKPRSGNLNTYGGNGTNNNSSSPYKGSTTQDSNNDNYRGSGNNAGGFLRNVFSNEGSSSKGGNNSSSNSSSTPSSSSSSGSSSGSGSTAPVRKF